MKFGDVKANSCSLPLIVIVKAPRTSAHMADHLLAAAYALEERNRQGLGGRTRLVVSKMRKGRTLKYSWEPGHINVT